MITLTPLQRRLRRLLDEDERVAEFFHGKPVELADWLAVLMYGYGADAVVDEAKEVRDKVQQEAGK